MSEEIINNWKQFCEPGEKVDLSRIRRIQISTRALICLFYQMRGDMPAYVTMIDSGLPPDFALVSCHLNPFMKNLELTIAHPSFEPIPEGSEIPLLSEWYRLKCYAIATEEELEARYKKEAEALRDQHDAEAEMGEIKRATVENEGFKPITIDGLKEMADKAMKERADAIADQFCPYCGKYHIGPCQR